MKKSFFLLVGFVLSLALASCRHKSDDPDFYSFDHAVTVDSIVVIEGRSVEGGEITGAGVQVCMHIDNNIDSVNTENTHIIQSVLVTSYLEGKAYDRVLATADPLYTPYNNQKIVFEENEVLVAYVPSLASGKDLSLAVVFSGAAYLKGNWKFSFVGYDQNKLKTKEFFENK